MFGLAPFGEQATPAAHAARHIIPRSNSSPGPNSPTIGAAGLAPAPAAASTPSPTPTALAGSVASAAGNDAARSASSPLVHASLQVTAERLQVRGGGSGNITGRGGGGGGGVGVGVGGGAGDSGGGGGGGGSNGSLRGFTRNISAPFLGSFPFSVWNLMQIPSAAQTTAAMQRSAAGVEWQARDGSGSTAEAGGGSAGLGRRLGTAQGSAGVGGGLGGRAVPGGSGNDGRNIVVPGAAAASGVRPRVATTSSSGVMRPVAITDPPPSTVTGPEVAGVGWGGAGPSGGSRHDEATGSGDGGNTVGGFNRAPPPQDDASCGVEGVSREGEAEAGATGSGGASAIGQEVLSPTGPADGAGEVFGGERSLHRNQESLQEREFLPSGHRLGLGGTQHRGMYDDEDGYSSDRQSPRGAPDGRY